MSQRPASTQQAPPRQHARRPMCAAGWKAPLTPPHVWRRCRPSPPLPFSTSERTSSSLCPTPSPCCLAWTRCGGARQLCCVGCLLSPGACMLVLASLREMLRPRQPCPPCARPAPSLPFIGVPAPLRPAAQADPQPAARAAGWPLPGKPDVLGPSGSTPGHPTAGLGGMLLPGPRMLFG